MNSRLIVDKFAILAPIIRLQRGRESETLDDPLTRLSLESVASQTLLSPPHQARLSPKNR
jgi:hypothetical protein